MSNEVRIKLGLKKKCILKIWSIWEHGYHYFLRLKLGHAEDLLYFKVKTYTGPSLKLNDDEYLNKGDTVIELHFNNKLLFKNFMNAKSEIQMATNLVRSMKLTLQRFDTYLNEIEDQKLDIKALYGVTILYKGAEFLGFNVIDVPSKWSSRWLQLCFKTILVIAHPNGKKRLSNTHTDLSPRIITVSKKTFQNNVRSFGAVPVTTRNLSN
ncbi:hypothetical protein GMB86_10250 [Terrilactibacillus sp. BCM23-1]|uniref:YkoP-like domain-containing protein n=1 Tax=Terrilactibacillus tamarindi TaxID=2599694 RepID=A0A6N8CVN8_9BACI|nr:hypothetical protein [Terrilactibacillus tamarindi]MTT32386.1 hypothetical protein [Terrilactibacillus tamarindi]